MGEIAIRIINSLHLLPPPLLHPLSNLKFETPVALTHMALPFNPHRHPGRGDIPKRLILFSYWTFHLKGAPTSYTRQQRVIHIHNQENHKQMPCFSDILFQYTGRLGARSCQARVGYQQATNHAASPHPISCYAWRWRTGTGH